MNNKQTLDLFKYFWLASLFFFNLLDVIVMKIVFKQSKKENKKKKKQKVATRTIDRFKTQMRG